MFLLYVLMSPSKEIASGAPFHGAPEAFLIRSSERLLAQE